MSKMNPEVKARWVAALRSGEYKQTTKRLCDGDGGYCCLGVLCDLYAKNAGVEWEWTATADSMRLRGFRSPYYPPKNVREWAGFHEDVQPVEIGGRKASVAVHNDGVYVPRRTFAEIANAIEAQL